MNSKCVWCSSAVIASGCGSDDEGSSEREVQTRGVAELKYRLATNPASSTLLNAISELAALRCR